MFVDQVMTRDVVTVGEGTPISRAWELMQDGRFRHLPVVQAGTLIGMISDRDLQLAIARAGGDTAAAGTVGSNMWRGVETTTPETPVEDASRLMQEQKIGALPVLEGDRLVGIVTESDLFRMLVGLLGLGAPSTRLELELVTPTRQLAELTALANDLDVPIVSLFTEPSNERGARIVVLRVASLAPQRFIEALEAAGISARAPATV